MALTSHPVESPVLGEMKDNDKDSPPPAPAAAIVDPFLVEALENPRHRLTILRMELDIQKFMQNSNVQQFEFPHFPTSYLRLAAHRVAYHYGLQTMVLDNSADGQGIRILVLKKPECKFPKICLLEVPAKETENDTHDQIKIVTRSRPKASSHDANKLGLKRSPVRSVEERKEEYERARARIFSSPSHSGSEDTSDQVTSDERNMNAYENEISKNISVGGDKNLCIREIVNSSRVAILRDREKDLTDPDYDRSYNRYARSIPNPQNFNLTPLSVQNFQPPFVHYDSVFPQMGRIPAPQASLNYMTPAISPYCAMGSNQTSMGGLYVQWPTQSVMYAQSYDQLRHAFFQGPFCQQQPLSFDYSQNHHR